MKRLAWREHDGVPCRWGACLGLLVLVTGPAWAQDRPPIYPTRDVAVTYAGGPTGPLHMSWLAAQHLERSDIAPGIWSLHDEAAHTTVMVNDAQKAELDMPFPDPTEIGSQPDATFTRDGTDSIGGQACTIWVVHEQGADATICKTADGVLLRTAAMGMTITATQVAYGPQDPARFHIPADYRKQATP